MPKSLRARAALAAVAIVGVALLIGSAAMVLLTRSSLTGNVREAAELRAEDVATAWEGGGASPTDLAVEDQEDGFIQVVGADGTVVASSENVDGEQAVADLDDEDATVLDHGPVGSERFAVVGLTAHGADGDVTVLVGRALDGADEATVALIKALAIVVPLVLLVVGLVAWKLVGRALDPVAEMTEAAQAITDSELDRRLPASESTDEIGRLNRTLNAMLDRLAQGRDRLSAFVADAAHELRTPVSGLRQHAEVAAEHPDSTDVAELASVVRGESLRLQALVDDLLLLARADEGRAGPTEAVDLDDVVATVLARRPATTEPTIDRSALSGGQVRGDPVALDRLVANLVDNAVRHADARVAVAVREDDGVGTVTLVVDDDGPGVPPADRERVFERFVRLDGARARDTGGSGLGLAIVRAVAQDHGAEVTLDDSPSGGARVAVVFPAA